MAHRKWKETKQEPGTAGPGNMLGCCLLSLRDGEVPTQKELSSYFEELFISKVPRQKELSSSNEELFPNPENLPVTIAKITATTVAVTKTS